MFEDFLGRAQRVKNEFSTVREKFWGYGKSPILIIQATEWNVMWTTVILKIYIYEKCFHYLCSKVVHNNFFQNERQNNIGCRIIKHSIEINISKLKLFKAVSIIQRWWRISNKLPTKKLCLIEGDWKIHFLYYILMRKFIYQSLSANIYFFWGRRYKVTR